MEVSIGNSNIWSEVTDNQIVSRILGGEKELFEILLRRNNQTVYRTVRSYLDNEDDIRDTMQDAYLKAYEKLEQFRRESAFSTWLVRIAINESLLRIRKYKKIRMNMVPDSELQWAKAFQLTDQNVMNPEKKIYMSRGRYFA